MSIPTASDILLSPQFLARFYLLERSNNSHLTTSAKNNPFLYLSLQTSLLVLWLNLLLWFYGC